MCDRKTKKIMRLSIKTLFMVYGSIRRRPQFAIWAFKT